MINQGQGIQVAKLLIHETGTYNQQWRRPYQTSLDANILNSFTERMNSVDKYQPSMLSGLAHEFITPSATPEKQVAIPNGWEQSRCRFTMEIHHTNLMGIRIREVVMGFTDHPGITHTGAVDRSMNFYISSTLQLRDLTERTPFGVQTYQSVHDSAHVLADNNWSNVYQPGQDMRMRPTDVFSAISRSHLPNLNDTLDTRTLVTSAAVKSRRSNTLPTNYVADILASYQSATNASQFGNGNQEILGSARGYASETPAMQDPFLGGISGVRGNVVGNSFTYGDLLSLDPNTDANCVVVYMDQVHRAEVHHVGQTADWGSTTLETQVATILAQSVPSLAMDLTITHIFFQANNLGFGGQVQMLTSEIEGFTNMDMSGYERVFRQRLEHEVLRGISFNGQMSFDIMMHVDLLGETKISISLNGAPFIDYLAPSFCDALTAPILTSNMQASQTLAEDFDMLFSGIQGNSMGVIQPGDQNFGKF